MRKYLGVILAFLAVVVSLAIVTSMIIDSRVEAQNFDGFGRTFTAQTATGQTAGTGGLKGTPVYHTIHLVVTGGPAACTYRLQGSRDGVTWFNISAADITCTSTITTFESSAKPARHIRGNLLTLSGGTAPTVTLTYIGR